MAKKKELDAKDIEARVHDLSKSMERMKSKQADRDDVVVELMQSQQTRLEMLARDMQSVFSEIPDGNDQFEFALSKGETPRLWVDMTTHVRMGRDTREYELVKDTKMGRKILASTADKNQMGQVITDYVADKILERERAIEGEWVALSGYQFESESEIEKTAVEIKTQPGGLIWNAIGWFISGAIICGMALFAWALFGGLPAFLQ